MELNQVDQVYLLIWASWTLPTMFTNCSLFKVAKAVSLEALIVAARGIDINKASSPNELYHDF